MNIQNINVKISGLQFRANNEQRKYNVVKNKNQNDVFELSVGYVNDIHGQTNNMIRILSGLKGDIKLSAGDNDIGDEKNKTTHLATAAFLEQADITATALGNHEFDSSQADFVDTFKNSQTKILSTNLQKEDDWQKREDNLTEYGRADISDTVKSSEIVDVKGEKIGLVGASPVDMFKRSTHPQYHRDCHVSELDESIEKIQKEVDNLKEKGVNKIFLLSHLGHKVDQRIAQETEGIDVIIGGHTHELITDIKEGENLFESKSGEPVILTEAGKDGSHFGLLNLTFDNEGVIIKAQNNVADTSNFRKNMINQVIFDEIMGKAEHIGYVKQASLPPASLLEENPHANFVCDAMKYMTDSEVAVWNNSGIRNFFHEGPIDSREIKDIAPFFDRISVAMVSEKTIVDMFKNAIKTSYTSNGNKPGLLAVSGLNYTVNSKGELVEMNFINKNGIEEKIDIDNPREDKKYKLVTDEYMMSADADYDKLADENECLEIYPYDKDVMVCEYIKMMNEPVVINQTNRVRYID